MGRRRPRVAQELPQSDYERERNENVLKNNRRMEELGITALSSTIKNMSSQLGSAKGKKSGNDSGLDEGSDSSEYAPEDEHLGQGDGDVSLDEEEPAPLMIKFLSCGTLKKGRKICTNRKKGSTKMPPGVRQPKRVRAGAPTEGTPVGVSTRSSKRQLRSVEDEDNEHDGNNGAEDVGNIQFPPENQLNMPQSPLRDWSYPDDAPQDVDGHSNSEEQTQDNDRVPTRRGPRDPRPPTRGIMLDAMTKSMGRRLPIAVEEGKKRPNDPVQAPKLASEAGVVIRAEVPILTHWKEYKKDPDSFENFMGKLSGRLAINRNDDATNDACTDVFKSAIRNKRYKLKKTYFVGVPAEQLSTTSPDPSMSDEQWRKLVAKWINPRNQEIAAKNKQNRGGFKYPQATGSRSYVAHLHAYKQKNKVSELDAVEAFKDCHTSRSKGISDAAKDAISAMENMMAEPISDGEPARSSAQVVSKVLSQDSSNSTFLKNAGL